MTRDDVLAYIRETYDVDPEYPWMRTPNSAILRHPHNRRWFAVLLDIPQNRLGLPGDALVDVLNVKCDPVLIGALRSERGIYPAYHMNKEHWVSVLLEAADRERAHALIDLSFDLTR